MDYKELGLGVPDKEGFLELFNYLMTRFLLKSTAGQLARPNDGRSDPMARRRGS